MRTDDFCRSILRLTIWCNQSSWLAKRRFVALIERWSRAVRDQDRAEIREEHNADILMFDLLLPFQSRGIEEYMVTWETFLSWSEKMVTFKFTDLEITAGG